MLSKKNQSAFESNTAFMVKIEDLVREIAIQNNIPYYRIESRMEYVEHMGAEDNYMPVIRIITYFEDTVNRIIEILRTELDMMQGRSIAKKKNSMDSFSYKRTHYFANLKANRRELIEYKRLGDKKFELQLCSMLQEAWSGVEHELGYDNVALPDESKRDFYRVGALLEMADIEFLKIRTEAAKNQEIHTEEYIPQSVAVAEPANTFVDHLQAVVKETPVAEAQPEITATAGAEPETIEAPVAEVVEEIATPVAAEPQVIIAEAQPEPIVEESVVVMQQPQAIEQAAEEAYMHKDINPVFANSIVPKSTLTETPKPAPVFGIAPQRIKFPVDEPGSKTDNPVMNVDSNGALEIYEIPERENYIIYEKIAEIVNTGTLVEQPAPAPQEEPQEVIINTVAPVVETIEPGPAPAVNKTSEIISEIIAPVIVENIASVNLNNTPKAQQFIPQGAPGPKEVPFYEDQAKNHKGIADENAPMNEASLREYVINSNLLKEVDMKIAERAGAKVNPDIDIEGDVERLRFLKVFTLKQLHDRLTDNKNDIVAFAEKWIGKDNGGSFDSGISLFYLEYLLVGKKNDPAFAIEYVVKFISDNDYSARYIIPTYNSIRNEIPNNNYSHLTIRA